MGRELRRVPLDFDWPQGKVWEGFLLPEHLRADNCPDCKNGYSPEAQRLFDTWYGYVPFEPASTGSTPLTAETPAVRAFAERNVAHSPRFYGTGENAIVGEAQRLADLWNGMWSHHLSQDDVDALIAADRLWDFTRTRSKEHGWQPIDPPVTPTAAQINEWSLHGFGHDCLNAGIVIEARCEREGLQHTCQTCGGRACVESYEGQRAEAEAWQAMNPPEGDGYQLWETVSEGSPSSPVFRTPEELASWMAANGEASSYEGALKFVAVGWAPSGGSTPEAGLLSGVDWVAATSENAA